MAKLSFEISWRGLPPPFLVAGAFFGFEEGGVLERSESSLNESGSSSSVFSASDSGLARFFVVFVAFRAVVVLLGAAFDFGAALVVAAFFAGAFAFWNRVSW